MSRIATRFAALLKQEGRGALIPFVEAWDPDEDDRARRSCDGMPEAGADLIEIGVPFTDPMADGPTIQARRSACAEGRRRDPGAARSAMVA